MQNNQYNNRAGHLGVLAVEAVLVSLALILSFLESLVPPFLPVPGIKIGLANIVIVFALYRLGMTRGAVISLVRVALASLLFGSLTSFIYGVSGAIVSYILMALFKRLGFGTVAVSTVGGVSHNIAQIAVASLLLGTNVVGYYLPFLILSGTLSGIAIGAIGALLVKKVPNVN